MILATEDVLSEAIATKLCLAAGLAINVSLGRRGNGYLRKKAEELNRVARKQSTLLLTDLDSATKCPAAIRQQWLGGTPSARMLFRVAVMEAEAWVLADAGGFASFAHVSPGRVPSSPDTIPDPKQTLVNLCRKSTDKMVREGMVPREGSTALIGPEYNVRLSHFVVNAWNFEAASARSPSLKRTLVRIQEHAARWPG